MTAPTDDTTGTLTRTEAETSTELAARPAPAADASEDDEEPLTRGTRVRTVAHLTALFSPSLHPHRRPNADGKIVRRMTSGDIYYDVRHDDGTVAGYERSELIDLTADASRPGLTEEQAREIAEDVATSFNARWSIGLGQGPLKDMADRIEAGVLRASRGETGPARVDTVWTGISVIARPAPDPRATLHAGDPAAPDPRVDYSDGMRPAVTGGECAKCLHAPPLHERTCPTLARRPR